MNTEPIDAMTRAINEYLMLANAVGISADDITGQIANRAMARVGLSRTEETPSLWPLGKRIAWAGVSANLWNLMTEEQREALAECIQDHITKPFLAPAPVEQASLEKAARFIVHDIETLTRCWIEKDEEEQAIEIVKASIQRHFQSLATEKPTSSPGEATAQLNQNAKDVIVAGAKRQAFDSLGETAEQAQILCEMDELGIGISSDPSPTAQSQTPMTDELIDRLYNSKLNMAEILAKVETHAESLETALAAAKEEIVRLARCISDDPHELVELRADRDALAEKLRRVEGERDEETRKLKEQFDLYCAETKRHNETWAQIHAATAYMDKECKNLPDGLLEKIREVFFRMTLVEMGRDELRDKTVPALTTCLAALQQQVGEAEEDSLLLDWFEEQARYECVLQVDEDGYIENGRDYTGLKFRDALRKARLARQPDQRQGEGV